MAAVAMVIVGCAADPLPGKRAGTGVNKPYAVNGVRYYPREDPDYDAVGTASWYGPGFHGRRTASGERYNMNAMTAAHTTLPFGTKISVTNLANGRTAVLTVNDRGPFTGDRIIDVSHKAATRLGFRNSGTARVRIRVLHSYAGVKPAEAAPPRRHASPDTEHFMPVLAQAMESSPRLEKHAWKNPESGRGGQIMPLTDPDTALSTGCRNYRRTIADGKRQTAYVGRACRGANGAWRITREEMRGS